MDLEEFTSILKASQEGVFDIIDKYSDFPQLFTRFRKALKYIRKQGCKRGLDFGTAHCAAVVLASSMGLEIEGVDLATSPYRECQARLISQGYRIHQFDTNEPFGWQLLNESQFDFVMFYHALNKGIDGDSSIMSRRIACVSKVLSPGACWFVWPGRHQQHLTSNPAFLQLSKEKGFRLEVGK